MDQLLSWLGVIFPLSFGAIGSCIGCGYGASALISGFVRTKSNHGALIAMSAAPSSQTIYGIVLMMSIKAKMADATVAFAPAGFFAIGLLCGIAIMFSAIIQGKCAAAGIRATLEDTGAYGKSWIPIGITESFAVFAMVFGIVMLG